MTTAVDNDARRVAEAAWAVLSKDARQAAALARSVSESNDCYARSVASRTLAFAALEGQESAVAQGHMQRALAEAHRSKLPQLVAEAEMGLAALAEIAGDGPSALRLSARAVARAKQHARLRLQRALVLDRLGRRDAALRAYDKAEELADITTDADTKVRVWCNRGVLLAYSADFDAAARDLLRAEDLAQQLNLKTLIPGIQGNLGFLAARLGDLVEGMGRLDHARVALEGVGGLPLGILDLDRAEALMTAGLAIDALRAARDAEATLAAAGMGGELAEARVIAAQAAYAVGELSIALDLCALASGSLRRNRAPQWRALCQEVTVRSRFASGQRTGGLARDAARVADELAAAGWASAAASARILAARIELSLGRRAQAEAQLRLVRDTPRSPVALRIQARCATALLRREGGDRRGARAALRSGWALLERHRATLGATELRAGASAHVAELVGIGLEMAIEDRRPREVLAWAERGRVGALTPRATAPPEDPELAALLGELRVVAAEADAAAKRGDDNRSLLRRQAQVEDRVRSRARLLPPEESGSEPPTVAPADLVAALEHRVLVQYVVSGGDLWAVVVARGRFALRRICTEPQVSDEVDGLRVALRRLAFGSPVPQLQVAARSGATYARDRLAELLFEPIADLIAGQPRVIVPMGVLHAVPWSALAEPGTIQTIAPSASLWARAQRTATERLVHPDPAPGDAEYQADGPTRGGRTVLVAGPRLAEAEAEIEAISLLRPGAERLGGAAATVDAVREAMGGASLAHLACHGQFRADNPLFSSLELHDGALSVFELERLGRSPEQIILSACDAGLSAVHPGDELLGLAAALLRLGTTGIIASVLPVPDAATRRLMEALHAELAGGATLAEALPAARRALDPERDDDLVASWAFQVLGAG